MKEIMHSKMLFELKKAKAIMERYDYPHSDIFRETVGYCINALNFFISSTSGCSTNIDAEYFFLGNIITPKRKLNKIIETYFFLKSLQNREYSMISRDMVVIRNWKQSIHLTKQDMISIIEKIDNMVLPFAP